MKRSISLILLAAVAAAPGCGAESQTRDAPYVHDQRGAYTTRQITGYLRSHGGPALFTRIPSDDLIPYGILEPAAPAVGRFGTFELFVVQGTLGLRFVLSRDGHLTHLRRGRIAWVHSETEPGVPAAWIAITRYRNMVLMWHASNHRRVDDRWRRLNARLVALARTVRPSRSRLPRRPGGTSRPARGHVEAVPA